MKLLLQIFKSMEKSEFHVLIKHCFLMEKILFKQSNGLMSVIWTLLSETMVQRCYADFKCGGTDTNDAECSGCPNSAVDPENIKKLHKLILANHKLKLHEIAAEMKISEGSVFTILHEHLLMRKLCSKWELCLLQSIKKNNTMMIKSIFCNCFNITKRSFCINMWQWIKHEYTIHSGVKLAVS